MIKPNPNLNSKTLKKLQYRKYVFMYGIISVLIVRDYFESVEDFEQCAVIMDALEEQEQRLDIVLPRVIDDKCIAEVQDVYLREGLTGINLLENSEYYAELIIREILAEAQPL